MHQIKVIRGTVFVTLDMWAYRHVDFTWFFLSFVRMLRQKYSQKFFRFQLYAHTITDKDLEYLRNVFIPRVWPIVSRELQIRFVHIPHCSVTNPDERARFFRAPQAATTSYVVKNRPECLECGQYFSCTGGLPKTLPVYPIKTSTINGEDFIGRLRGVLDFFSDKMDVPETDMCFILPFDMRHGTSGCRISAEFLSRIELNIRATHYDRLFLPRDNYKDVRRCNLFFKNYLSEQRFHRLLRRLWLSIVLSSWQEEHLQIHAAETISYHIFPGVSFLDCMEIDDVDDQYSIVAPKGAMVWRALLKGVWPRERTLQAVWLQDIDMIRDEFTRYVVLIHDYEVNTKIPHIYNFHYFLSSSSSNLLTHYMIIFRELWRSCVDQIDPGFLETIKTGTMIRCDFNTGSMVVSDSVG